MLSLSKVLRKCPTNNIGDLDLVSSASNEVSLIALYIYKRVMIIIIPTCGVYSYNRLGSG